jgi:hypothetical protein
MGALLRLAARMEALMTAGEFGQAAKMVRRTPVSFSSSSILWSSCSVFGIIL